MVPLGARERFRWRLLRIPGLAEAYIAADPRLRDYRITRRTDLVIDGYPRSGNTYALMAFVVANGPGLQVSSHLHTPRTIERAVGLGVPAIVLIRDPRAVFGSALQYNPEADARRSIADYTAFYRRVLPLADRVVVADFPDVVGDFGAVIERCNLTFGTDFVPYEKTEDNEAEVVSRVEEVAELLFGDDYEHAVGRPSTSRRTPDAIVERFDPSVRAVLAEAERVYETLVSQHSR